MRFFFALRFLKLSNGCFCPAIKAHLLRK